MSESFVVILIRLLSCMRLLGLFMSPDSTWLCLCLCLLIILAIEKSLSLFISISICFFMRLMRCLCLFVSRDSTDDVSVSQYINRVCWIAYVSVFV